MCDGGSSPTITNNIIMGNSALWQGGGIGCYNSASPTISNNTITGNSAIGENRGSGRGIFCWGNSHPIITNTILWGNSASMGKEICVVDTSLLTISYSDVENGQDSVYVEEGCTLNWGAGMIDEYPLFRTFKGFEYLLHPNSPCVDTGDPTIEDALYDWHPKWPVWYPNSSHSDMGAYGGLDNIDWIQ
jgi:parallel beta-helix repeat protein